MKSLYYQLKSVLHDKFCLMTFLLPIAVAIALHFAGSIDMSPVGKLHFGILENDLSEEMVAWLERYGTVTVYPASDELYAAVNEPSTTLIGVEGEGNGIKTILSGDELDVFRLAAHTLPVLYKERDMASQVKTEILERPDLMEGYQNMFIAATLIVAMFMGCTFNAMNIISEKEDGVAFINEILPMTRSRYIVQKLAVGFIFGCLSSLITVCICFRLSLENAVLMLALVVLSAFVAALIGLVIGRASGGLMVGVVYIKIVMLLFIAVPIASFLIGSRHPIISAVCCLVPSQAAFEGIMDLSAGGGGAVMKDIFILLAHCAGWFGALNCKCSTLML